MLVDPRATVADMLRARGISRRGFMKFCATTASLMALAPSMTPKVAEALQKARRTSVIWLPFQECTGCKESLTRAGGPTLENLIFDAISLDYSETLMAAAGHQAEEAMKNAIRENWGNYLLLVDGSLPVDVPEYSVIGGVSNLEMLKEVAAGAKAVVAIGTCSAFGGLPAARPNPTGARPISDVVKDKPLINVPGCPPMPIAITSVLVHYLTFGTLPELDHLNRPKSFFGQTIHDRCYRRPFYERGQFAESFDDEGAKAGWCLFKVGCKGPTTYNGCATYKWNLGASWPVESGHGCLGCSEPNFWDWQGFYNPLSTTQWGGYAQIGAAAAAGAAAGAVAALAARRKQRPVGQDVQEEGK
ncbi:MAG: hydrogenase small subunit [Steroidobacteraceae bacterium]|nr:hydrogenase small subunit [Steroidobacteraceae bacterium]